MNGSLIIFANFLEGTGARLAVPVLQLPNFFISLFFAFPPLPPFFLFFYRLICALLWGLFKIYRKLLLIIHRLLKSSRVVFRDP